MIPATVGRIVWFHPEGGTPNGDPHAAKIAAVNDDGTVNLGVIDHNGNPYARQNVFLRQDGEANPFATTGGWAQWMPYQVGQAKKHDAPAAPAIDVGSVTKAIDELAAGTQNKFLQFGSWLNVHVGSLMNRVSAIEGQPPSMLPHPNDAPAAVPEAGANAPVDAAAAEVAKAAAANQQQ